MPVSTNHPLVQGVEQFRVAAPVTFDYGSDWRLLASGAGQPVMAVLEAMSGDADFAGRILVVGDSNCFTEAYIAEHDTTTLAANMVAWASTPPDTAGFLVADHCGCSTPGGNNPAASWLLFAMVVAAAAWRRSRSECRCKAKTGECVSGYERSPLLEATAGDEHICPVARRRTSLR